ncbi:MAG: SDR family NAD(P)-dependent oxidoreductase [Planctomycetes bacterium]|nr:SDR family NAD(P)-dependent oxidoreductase [Planctomycetota bacterium]
MPVNADGSSSSTSLRGKSFLLVGATGALGEALVRHLLSGGAKVGLAVRRERQIAPLAATLPKEQALVGLVPPGDGEAAAGFVKGVQDSLGPLTALISTAGAFLHAPAGQDRPEALLDLLDANLLATHTLVRAVLPALRRRGGGGLVFTGAAVVGKAVPGLSLYLAAKSALHAYAETLHAELAPEGIRVAVIAPGTLDTEANRRAMPGIERSTLVPLARVVDALAAAALGTLPGSGAVHRVV